MKRFIKRLQEQPREVKSHAAFIGAVAATALVALVWVTTLPARFSSVAGGVDVKHNVATLAESVKSELPTPPIDEVNEAEEMQKRVDILMDDIRRSRDEQKKSASGDLGQPVVPTATPEGIEAVTMAPASATSTTPTTSLPIRIQVR